MRRKEREENEVAEMKARKEALANAKEKGKAKAKSKKKKDKKDEAPKPADGSKPSVPYSGAAWGAMPPAAADGRSGSRPAESRVLGVLGGTQPLSGGTCGTAIVHRVHGVHSRQRQGGTGRRCTPALQWRRHGIRYGRRTRAARGRCGGVVAVVFSFGAGTPSLFAPICSCSVLGCAMDGSAQIRRRRGRPHFLGACSSTRGRWGRMTARRCKRTWTYQALCSRAGRVLRRNRLARRSSLSRPWRAVRRSL